MRPSRLLRAIAKAPRVADMSLTSAYVRRSPALPITLPPEDAYHPVGEWDPQRSLPVGSIVNPHASRDAPRNPELSVNYWSYAGDEEPVNWAEGDEWWPRAAAEGSE
jgi:hypothetical protein